MKKLKLYKNLYALVDNEDYPRVASFRWHVSNRGYVVHSIRNKEVDKKILLHAFIMNTPKGMNTDHINGNKLDNRRSNLRICEHLKNSYNRRMNANNTSGFKGVMWFRETQKWRAVIGVGGRKISLGYFKIKEDAAEAYKLASEKYHGEFAGLRQL